MLVRKQRRSTRVLQLFKMYQTNRKAHNLRREKRCRRLRQLMKNNQPLLMHQPSSLSVDCLSILSAASSDSESDTDNTTTTQSSNTSSGTGTDSNHETSSSSTSSMHTEELNDLPELRPVTDDEDSDEDDADEEDLDASTDRWQRLRNWVYEQVDEAAGSWDHGGETNGH